jgi:hypothetical protein
MVSTSNTITRGSGSCTYSGLNKNYHSKPVISVDILVKKKSFVTFNAPQGKTELSYVIYETRFLSFASVLMSGSWILPIVHHSYKCSCFTYCCILHVASFVRLFAIIAVKHELI